MAYYSREKNPPEVYHVCRNCPEGSKIEERYLAEGKPPGATLCTLCDKLRHAGQCPPWNTNALRNR